MDGHSIDRIRNASFAHAVRGYDRHEVDQFLRELADWLEEGGESEAATEQIRAELERVGDQTGAILTEAHERTPRRRRASSSSTRT